MSSSKAKENLNNLDTKALGREVISSCASVYVTIPEIALRGAVAAILVRTTNANSDEFENVVSVSMFMEICWSRRSSRENNAGLACGHEQMKREESANAAQRRGTVECPR